MPSSPTLVQGSSVSTDNLVTPSSTAIETPVPIILNGQHQNTNQQNALRALQQQMARGLGNVNGINPAQLTPAVIQNLLVAAKNGNVDPNNPAMQQFKNLLMLQQQQKQAQIAMNPGAAAAPGSGNTAGVQVPASINQINPMVSKQLQPPSTAQINPSLPVQAIQSSRPAKFWSGDIAWMMNTGASGQQNSQ